MCGLLVCHEPMYIVFGIYLFRFEDFVQLTHNIHKNKCYTKYDDLTAS